MGQVIRLHRVDDDGAIAGVDEHGLLMGHAFGFERLECFCAAWAVDFTEPGRDAVALVGPDASSDEVDHGTSVRACSRCVTASICYMTDVATLSLSELTNLSTAVAREIRARRPPNRTCAACGRGFAARVDALYCSTRCRVAQHRLRRRKERDVSIEGIGYEGQAIDALVSKLRIRGVETLVDVRLNAISRKRGFSKRALAAALEGAGIAYVHMPVLGNQRDNRAGYGELDSPLARQVRERFTAELQAEAALEALEELANLARTGPVAVFCYEADEQHCHREQVLEQVRGILDRALVAR